MHVEDCDRAQNPKTGKMGLKVVVQIAQSEANAEPVQSLQQQAQDLADAAAEQNGWNPANRVAESPAPLPEGASARDRRVTFWYYRI